MQGVASYANSCNISSAFSDGRIIDNQGCGRFITHEIGKMPDSFTILFLFPMEIRKAFVYPTA
jgi:hypothetical protein